MIRHTRAPYLKYALIAATALATPAMAQTAEANAQDAIQRGGVEDIVVTARKRAESIQDIPVSIVALSSERIDRMDLTSIEKVAAMTPQFQVSRSAAGSAARLNLRGIGSSSSSIGIEQSVAVVVDGVYYGQGRIINEGFFDLERVEILKGPQALFFGKNATAGVVSITTADPKDELEAMARIGYEFNAQQVYGEGFVSGPLSDTLGVRVAARASHMSGGLFENHAVDQTYTTYDSANGGAATVHDAPAGSFNTPKEKDILVRATLKWEPTDRFSGTLKTSYSRSSNNNPGWNAVPYKCASGTTFLNPDNKCGRNFVHYGNRLPQALAESFEGTRSDGNLFNKYNSFTLSGTLTYDFDNVTLTSVTNYNDNRNRNTFEADYASTSRSGTYSVEDTNFNAFSSELRAHTSFEGPINLLIGGYYQKTKREFAATVATGGAENSAAPAHLRYASFNKLSETDGETLSIYGQVMWEVLPRFEVTGGVRYIYETKDSFYEQPYVAPALSALFIGGDRLSADQTFSNWSPEITASWKPQSNITVYGAYKTAYKSGGFSNSSTYVQATSVEDLAFGPEKAMGFEGGIKTMLMDRQLRLDLGLFSYKYQDLQVDYFNSSTFAYITTNAGSARTKGVELEAEFAPRDLEGLTFRGAINYTRARYANFQAPCYSGQTPEQGCTDLSPRGARFQDISGAPTAVAPEWTGALGVGYEGPVSNSLIFGANVDARYSSSYLPSAFNNPYSKQPAYVNLDASARIRTADDKWELAVIGKNLTNRFVATGVVDGPSTGSGTGTPAGVHADQIGYIAMPRTVQVQATWRY